MIGNELHGELISTKMTHELLHVLVGVMAITGIPETRLKCDSFKFILSIRLHAPESTSWWKSQECDEETEEEMKRLLVYLANDIAVNNPGLELKVINFEVNLAESGGFSIGNYGTVH